MVVTKITRKFNNGRETKKNLNYNSFDEADTLATLSNLSMSLSEECELINEDKPKALRNNNNLSNRRKSLTKDSYNKQETQTSRGKGKTRRGSKPVSRATSTKPHDAPMSRSDIYFALDCEMVGVGYEGLDSALARVSIVNWDNAIVLDTYVKVDQPVTDYRTFVSGIRPEQIQSDSAMTLSEVQRIVASILQGKILIGHGLNNDLKVMGINHPWCDIRDTATYKPFMRMQDSRSAEDQATLCPRKLKELVLEKLGKEIQVMGKAHSPVEDAVAAMDLYKAVRGEWETDMMKQVNVANQANDVHRQTIHGNMVYRQRDTGMMPLFQNMPYQGHGPQPSYRPALCYNHQMYPSPISPINSMEQAYHNQMVQFQF